MTESEAKLIESMADDYSNVLKEAKSMGCKEIRALYNIPLKNMELIINALEKQIPKKPKSTHIKYGKHTWAKKENGEIDDFAWDYEYHNGVVCEVCGKTVCEHCNPQYDRLTDCEDEYYNCPSCGKKIFSAYKYCDCGQKIDWSDSD